MRKFIQALALAALFFPTASCVSEEVRIGSRTSGEDTEVLLQLRTPREFGSTRGLSVGEERAIGNVYVLEFDADAMTLKAIEKAVVASNESSFAVTLEPSEDGETSKLMVLANAETVLSDEGFIGTGAAGKIGDDYDDVCAAIYGTIAGPMYPTGGAIPMWGETGAIEISPDNSNNQSVALTRSIARIDVGVGTPDNTGVTNGGEWEWDGTIDNEGDTENVPFRLASVHVFRANKRYALIPDAVKLAAEDATVPTGTTKFDYTPSPAEDLFEFDEVSTDELYLTQQIYVPEADIEMGGTKGDTNHTNRMAIVVGGTFDKNGNGNFTDDSDVTYYRLDFAEEGTLMNVLRNHLYQFNIDSVTGDGYDDPVEAYESQTINMSCTILAWNEGATGNVGFDGPYHMSLSPGVMGFSGEEGTQTLTLDTDYPTWTAEISANEDGTGGAPAWLTFDPELVSGEGSDAEQEFEVHVGKNITGRPQREAWITVKAGDRLTAKVRVIQDIAGIKAVKGVIGYISNPGQPNHRQMSIEGDKSYYGNPAGELQSDQGEYTVYVAYFKFGSLVATSGQNTGAFTSDDIVAWPTQWAADRTTMEGKIGTVTGQTSWTNIPVPVSADLTRGDTIATNLTEGLGDPCDYWFGDHDGDGATATATENWRLPTAKENTVFVGGDPNDTTWKNWVPGSTSYLFTSTTGTGSGTSWPYYYSASGVATTTAGTFAAPATGRFPVAAQTGRAAFSEVLPATGNRSTNGSVSSQGSDGYYWSSTEGDGLGGYVMGLGNSMRPSNNSNSANGFSVRCIHPLIIRNSPTPFYDGVTQQKIAVEFPGPWTVTENVVWLDIVSGATGNGNGSFTLRAVPDMVNEQPASYYAPGKVTVTNGISTVELDVEFLAGGYDNILYFDSSDRLMIGKWAPAGVAALRTGTYNAITAADQLAFFKFGSVIGFTSVDDDWNNEYIRFDPSGVGSQITQFTPFIPDVPEGQFQPLTNSSTANELPNIPGYDPQDDLSVTNISDPAYNTYTYISAGKGDPCQLIGLTGADIRAAGGAGLQALLNNRAPEYKGWRMATVRENINFAGESELNFGVGNWTTWVPWVPGNGYDIEIPGVDATGDGWTAVYDYWDDSFTPTLGRFPSQPQGGYRAHRSQIIPIVEPRASNSGGQHYFDAKTGEIANIWSSTPDRTSLGTEPYNFAYALSIYEYRTVSEDTSWFSSGNLVRCVR